MQLAAAVLCDHASVRESLLMVVAGGITRVWREQLPAPLGADVALLIEMHRMETGRPHELQVVVMDQDGKNIATVQAGFNIEDTGDLMPGETTLVPLPVKLAPLLLEQYGRYSVEISLDGQHQRSLHFRVLPVPSGDSQVDGA